MRTVCKRVRLLYQCVCVCVCVCCVLGVMEGIIHYTIMGNLLVSKTLERYHIIFKVWN